MNRPTRVRKPNKSSGKKRRLATSAVGIASACLDAHSLARTTLSCCHLLVLFGQATNSQLPPSLAQPNDVALWTTRALFDHGLHRLEKFVAMGIDLDETAERLPALRNLMQSLMHRQSSRVVIIRELTLKLRMNLAQLHASAPIKMQLDRIGKSASCATLGPVSGQSAHAVVFQFAEHLLDQLKIAVRGDLSPLERGSPPLQEPEIELPQLLRIIERFAALPEFGSIEFRQIQQMLSKESRAEMDQWLSFPNLDKIAKAAGCTVKTVTNRWSELQIQECATGYRISRESLAFLAQLARPRS